MNEPVKDEGINKNKLLDAYAIYRNLKNRDVKVEDMTDEEKHAWTVVTRDRKFMSVLDSFPEGTEPDLVDILSKYNKLLDESKPVMENPTPSQSIREAEERAIQNAKQQTKVKELINRNNRTQAVTKLNQTGYANIILMSIIILIIVAIICVFIFVK